MDELLEEARAVTLDSLKERRAVLPGKWYRTWLLRVTGGSTAVLEFTFEECETVLDAVGQRNTALHWEEVERAHERCVRRTALGDDDLYLCDKAFYVNPIRFYEVSRRVKARTQSSVEPPETRAMSQRSESGPPRLSGEKLLKSTGLLDQLARLKGGSR